MKTNILSIALAFCSVVAVAQKKEIKDAGKALENGNYAEAKNLLQQAEPNLSETNDKYQADYYLFKGKALVGTGENTPLPDLIAAAEAFKKAQELGNEEASQGLASVTNSLVQGAINDQNAQKFESAAEKLYAGYQMNKQDTLYLYYAASNEVSAGNYEKALKYYEELEALDYTGVETLYVAVNKETGEEEAMDKTQRDLMVKTGNYINPEDRVSESKVGEIAKNIALIYIELGQNEKAIAAMENAKAANPDDINLLQSEADMYYQMGDKEKYKEIMQNIVAKNPDNPTLYYNLGVTSYEIGDVDAAIDYYKKALELDPKLVDAKLNIAAAILSKEAGLVEQMNGLGMSKADTEKYDQLAEERKEIYKQALPYLEEVIENNPENIEALRTTMNIYYQIGEKEKAEALQTKITAAQSGQ